MNGDPAVTVPSVALPPGALSSALLATVVGLGASLVLTPLVGRLARISGAVDLPGPRKVHDRPLPRLGGVAVNLAFWLAAAVAALSGPAPAQLVGFALASALIVAVGVYDDHRDAPKSLRFLVQAIAAEIAVQSGFRLTVGRWLLSSNWLLGESCPPALMDAFEHALTIFWIMGVTNAMNLLDGLNFLCAGTALVSAFSLALVACASGHGRYLCLYAALVGSLAAFGVFNRAPASIFLGDSGSTFLGFFLACFAAYQGGQGNQASAGAPLVPVVLLTVPVFDTLYAIGRRLYLRVSPFSGDRGHLHHRLLAMGYDQAGSVRVLALASLWQGLAAVGFAVAGPQATGALFVVVLAGMGAFIRALKLFDPAVVRAGRCHETLQRGDDPM